MKWNMDEAKQVECKWLKNDGTPGTATDVKVTSSDEAVATGVYKDGFAVITNVSPGKTTFTVAGDTDPGDGVVPVSNTFEVEIAQQFADHLEFADAVDQPKP